MLMNYKNEKETKTKVKKRKKRNEYYRENKKLQCNKLKFNEIEHTNWLCASYTHYIGTIKVNI